MIVFMRKLLFFCLLILPIMSFISSVDNQDEMVFVCDNHRVKCFYYLPCEALRNECQGNKIFRVSLNRAKLLGKEKCNCEND